MIFRVSLSREASGAVDGLDRRIEATGIQITPTGDLVLLDMGGQLTPQDLRGGAAFAAGVWETVEVVPGDPS